MKIVPKAAGSKSRTSVARKYRVLGRVQGVGYRFFAQRLATKLGISGYIKNLCDGSVEVYAIGEESDLDAFKRQLAQGPIAASVASIEESEEAVRSDYNGFFIEHG